MKKHPLKKHPLVVALDHYRLERPDMFKGRAEGPYLANRLNDAFTSGWLAAEARVKNALSELVNVPTGEESRDE